MANDIMMINIDEISNLIRQMETKKEDLLDDLTRIINNVEKFESNEVLEGNYADSAAAANGKVNTLKTNLDNILSDYIKVLNNIKERREQTDKEQANKLEQNNDNMKGKGSGGGGGGGQQKPKEENKDKNKNQASTSPYDNNKSDYDYKPKDDSSTKSKPSTGTDTINNDNERNSSSPTGSGGGGGSQPTTTSPETTQAPSYSGEGTSPINDEGIGTSEELETPEYEDMSNTETDNLEDSDILPVLDEGEITSEDPSAEPLNYDLNTDDNSLPTAGEGTEGSSTLTKASIGGMLLGSGAVAAGLSRKRNEDEDGETMSYTEEQEWSDLDNLSNIYDNQDVNNVSW